MKDLIDELSEIIYVVDLDTYNLLFINDTGKERFKITDIENRKCYEALHGRSEPCEFCNNCHLSEENFITWECDNKKVGRHYLLRDSLIDWNGKKAKVEIACDITEQVKQRVELREMLDGQNLIVNCVQKLHEADNILDVLNDVSEMIGSFIGAERVYIYENCPEEGVEGAHVYYAPDAPDALRGGIKEECRLLWRRKIPFKKECTAVRNICVIKKCSREAYESMVKRGITRLVAVPLELEKNCIGYIEIDNPPEERIDKIVPLISTLAYFISSCMCICKNRRRLERMSYLDGLTGVKNRNAYNQFIKTLEHEDAGSVGVVYIDVNDMKGINDKYGHSFGDHILVALAGILMSYFDKEEIFRIDGDEFVIICRDETKARFSGKVRSFMRDVDGRKDFGVSAGYQWSDNGESIKMLIDASDKMMYENKKGYYFKRPMPRHCRYQYDEMKELLNMDTLESRLAAGGFPVYLQPKMAVDGHRLIGAEALIRYRDKNGSTILPDRFIPLLEDNRLIDMVDFYVYDSICRQISEWKKKGIALIPVSVNFSRYTLMDVNFLEWLERIPTLYGIDRKYVEIEVTESADTDEGFDFLGMIGKIRAAGFSVSIDDFGVKYANLFLFSAMNFDILKIDKSLSQDLACNEKARAILRSISDICKSMGIEMIVEGIETEEQMHILEEMGCYGVQGYYFSRPVPIPEFESRYLPGDEKESA